MADEDIREILNIPAQIIAHGKTVEVRSLSAIELIQLFDRVMVLASKLNRAKQLDLTDGLSVLRTMVTSDPAVILGLVAPATNLTIDEIGALDLDVFLEVVELFLEKHRKAIVRFFGLRVLAGDLAREVAQSSPKRSTRSSAQGGATKTSETSPSSNSLFSESEPVPATSGGNSTT